MCHKLKTCFDPKLKNSRVAGRGDRAETSRAGECIWCYERRSISDVEDFRAKFDAEVFAVFWFLGFQS